MTRSVTVRCPVCRHEQSFAPPTFPCSCGAPVTLPVPPDGTPEVLAHRTWEDCWVLVGCPTCARRAHWPQPELGCPCGTVIRVPVTPSPEPASEGTASGTPESAAPGAAEPLRRPAFRPVTIRTSRDAVNAAAQYLRWLGFGGLRHPENRSMTGVDLRGDGLVAQVDPTTHPTTVREVECLFLTALRDSVSAVFFSLAGYARDARRRADELRLPLFVMDLTGTPQPVNDPADELIRSGPPGR
ncbi:hypothetical protein [Streptomyces sp. NPDC018031]|uniref:hypothetical protein n=1 Tax=Streptomyces sp. NPDC018031 TaxID=3365033 RepID=UPI00379A6EC2